jgi:hypothetical protein
VNRITIGLGNVEDAIRTPLFAKFSVAVISDKPVRAGRAAAKGGQ